MVDSTSPDAGLNTLLTQYLFDDADVAKISPFVLSLLSADRLFETAARVDGSNVVKKWISRLQVLLHHADPKTRRAGLSLLCATVDQCPFVVFSHHCPSWMGVSLQFLKRHESTAVQAQAAHLFCTLLRTAMPYAELRRDATETHLPRFATAILTSTGDSDVELQILSFQALADCIRSAPGPMRPFAEKIERACLSHIDSPHRTLVQTVAACLAETPMSGKVGTTPSELWTLLLDRIMGSTHLTLDSIFSPVLEVHLNNERSSEHLSLVEIQDMGTLSALSTLNQRLENLICALSTMLRNPLRGVVTVPLAGVLDLIGRILAINRYTPPQYGDSATYRALCTALPVYHCLALQLLKYACLRLRTGIIPHITTISGHLTSVFDSYFADKTFRRVQTDTVRLYAVLAEACGPSLPRQLVELCVRQCIKQTKSVCATGQVMSVAGVNVITGFKQERAPGSGRKKGTDPSATSPSVQNGPEDIDFLCAAIRAMAVSLLRTTSVSGSNRTAVDSWACMQLVMYQTDPWNTPSALHTSDVRLALYQFVHTSLFSPGRDHAPYLQQSLRLFKGGLNDPCPSITSFCYVSMACCDALIRPRVPCVRPAIIDVVQANQLVTPMYDNRSEDMKECDPVQDDSIIRPQHNVISPVISIPQNAAPLPVNHSERSKSTFQVDPAVSVAKRSFADITPTVDEMERTSHEKRPHIEESVTIEVSTSPSAVLNKTDEAATPIAHNTSQGLDTSISTSTNPSIVSSEREKHTNEPIKHRESAVAPVNTYQATMAWDADGDDDEDIPEIVDDEPDE